VCKAPVGFAARCEQSGCSKSSGGSHCLAMALFECLSFKTKVQVSVFQDEGSSVCLSRRRFGDMSIFQDGEGKAALRGTFWND